MIILLTACEVHFDNTPVPLDNILGNPGDGFKVSDMIILLITV